MGYPEAIEATENDDRVGIEGKDKNQKLRLKCLSSPHTGRKRASCNPVSQFQLNVARQECRLRIARVYVFFYKQARHLDLFHVNFLNFKCWQLKDTGQPR